MLAQLDGRAIVTVERICKTPTDRKAAILKKWTALTNEDLEIAGNDRNLLAVRIVERYGMSLEWAIREIETWEAELLNSKAD